MSRKRLGSIDPSRARDARTSAQEAAATKRKSALGSAPPIAKVAASVSEKIEAEMAGLKKENRDLAEKGRALDTAASEGRLVVALDLASIDPIALSRDRRQLQKSGEEWAALKASIQARGQQTPIEVSANGSLDGPAYDLISGLRRLSVLEELHQETGEDRFATVLAFVRQMPDTVPKMIAMIEENEIRQDISFFERGRICSVATAEGAFDTVETAIDTLFEPANRNRRYKIRCFVTVYEEIGTLLDFPEQIGERLGIALAKAIREGRGGMLVSAFEHRNTRFAKPQDELALLAEFVAQKGPFAPASSTKAVRKEKSSIEAEWHGEDGASIKAKSLGGKITLTLKGLPDLDQTSLQSLVNDLVKKHR